MFWHCCQCSHGLEGRIEYELPGDRSGHGTVEMLRSATHELLPKAVTEWPFCVRDPDVIMIGEIRDLETAQIAVKHR